jgi:hypothetical protein
VVAVVVPVDVLGAVLAVVVAVLVVVAGADEVVVDAADVSAVVALVDVVVVWPQAAKANAIPTDANVSAKRMLSSSVLKNFRGIGAHHVWRLGAI